MTGRRSALSTAVSVGVLAVAAVAATGVETAAQLSVGE